MLVGFVKRYSRMLIFPELTFSMLGSSLFMIGGCFSKTLELDNTVFLLSNPNFSFAERSTLFFSISASSVIFGCSTSAFASALLDFFVGIKTSTGASFFSTTFVGVLYSLYFFANLK